MKRVLFLSMLLLLAWAQPVPAQDDSDDEIEVGEGDGKEAPEKEDDGYDEDETRKKNVGLAGGGKRNDDDPNAPKVKMSLQMKINEAIKGGVAWLKKRRDKNGNWGPVEANRMYNDPSKTGKFYRDELGPTAWSVYTLAKCGVKKSDPAIKKGMKYVFDQTKFTFDKMGGKPDNKPTTLQKPSRKTPRVLTTYEAAAIVMMIEAVYEGSAKLTGKHRKRRLHSSNPLKPPSGSRIPKEVWKYMHDRIVFLTVGRRGGGGARGKGGRTIAGAQVPKGKNKGGWRYGQGTSGDADLSATQFVLLALRAASQAGYPVEKVSKNAWLNAANYVKKCKSGGSGAYGYQRGGGKATGSMNACAIGCLLICKEQMLLAKEHDSDAPSPPGWIDAEIKSATGWLDENFRPNGNPGGSHTYYYLYGVERVGDLAGRKEFNGLDWYVRGAQFLLSHQDASGKWTDGTAFKPQDVIGTCFALLFLKRATPPVVTLRER